MDINRRERCGGQAMTELMMGLVSLIVLIAILAQLAIFVRAGHETAFRAREQAGALALQPFPVSAVARYIGATRSGDDGKPYTRDDEFLGADPTAFYNGILEPLAATPTDWNTLDAVPGNDFTRLRSSESPIGIFGLLRGQAPTNVTLLPAVEHLLYRRDSIRLEETVWMPWTKGVY